MQSHQPCAAVSWSSVVAPGENSLHDSQRYLQRRGTADSGSGNAADRMGVICAEDLAALCPAWSRHSPWRRPLPHSIIRHATYAPPGTSPRRSMEVEARNFVRDAQFVGPDAMITPTSSSRFLPPLGHGGRQRLELNPWAFRPAARRRYTHTLGRATPQCSLRHRTRAPTQTRSRPFRCPDGHKSNLSFVRRLYVKDFLLAVCACKSVP